MDPEYDPRDETHARPQVGFLLKPDAYDDRVFFQELAAHVRSYHDMLLFDESAGEVPGVVRFRWETPRAVVDAAADYLSSLPFVIRVFRGYGGPIDAT